MAIRVLRMNSDTNPLSYKWITKFIICNPHIVLVIGRPIKAYQIRYTN